MNPNEGVSGKTLAKLQPDLADLFEGIAKELREKEVHMTCDKTAFLLVLSPEKANIRLPLRMNKNRHLLTKLFDLMGANNGN